MANIFHTNKLTAKALNWLQSGASKDEARPVLTGVHVDDHQAISANGFSLFAVDRDGNGMSAIPEGLRKHDRIKASGGEVIEPDEIHGVYPM